MTPARAVLVERAALALGAFAMAAAVALFDVRLGLFFAGLLIALSALDIPWRRP